MVGSPVGQTHARMLGMASVISRTSTRLLASAPNYIEASALIAIAVASRLLHHPIFWSFNARLCASIALIITVFLYACVGKGQILAYLGWVKPRSPIDWLYALVGGLSGAAVVALLMRSTGGSLGTASANELFYGATIGPIIEEIIYRGAAFSVVYVTACSFNTLGALADRVTSLALFSVLRMVAHKDHWTSLAARLDDGNRLRTCALAFKFHRSVCVDACLLQRFHCFGHASFLNFWRLHLSQGCGLAYSQSAQAVLHRSTTGRAVFDRVRQP